MTRVNIAVAAAVAVLTGATVGFLVHAANEIDPNLQTELRAQAVAAKADVAHAQGDLNAAQVKLDDIIAKLDSATPYVPPTTTTPTTPTETTPTTTTPTTTTPTTTTPAFTADRYVSPTGDDAAAGTEAAPWRTIQKALATATAGQTVALRGGTYSGTINVSRSGTSTAPITIVEYPGEMAIYSQGGTPFNLTGSAGWWVFKDFTIRGATGSSTTNIYGQATTHDIVFDGVEIRDSTRQGVFLEQNTARYTFQNCLVTNNGGSGPVQQDHGLYLEGTGHVVRNCTVRNQSNGYGIQVYPFARSTLIQGNVIENVPLRAGVIIGSDVRDTVVENNTFRSPMGGVGGLTPQRAVGSCCGIPAAGNNVVRSNTANFAGAFGAMNGLTYSGNTIVP